MQRKINGGLTAGNGQKRCKNATFGTGAGQLQTASVRFGDPSGDRQSQTSAAFVSILARSGGVYAKKPIEYPRL
jgi:hypothetical protein